MSALCVLPARLDSRRLPGKLLREVAGAPLIRWSWEAARRVPAFDEVCVATDSDRVEAAAREFGARVARTRSDHESGTDRVAEVAGVPAARSFDIVVNYQADEPFLPPDAVGRAVRVVREGGAEVATLAAPIRSREEWRSESVVKVARAADGRALYFSRAAIPHPREGEPSFQPPGDHPADADFLRHAGLYVFTRPALERWAGLAATRLEALERLEQLRALEAGLDIHVTVAAEAEPGVDVPGDLERADRLLRGRKPSGREHHG